MSCRTTSAALRTVVSEAARSARKRFGLGLRCNLLLHLQQKVAASDSPPRSAHLRLRWLPMLALLAAGGVGRASATEANASADPAIPLAVAVDPRVELISIIYRFAGNPEYSRCKVPAYAKAVDAQFAEVREHPVVLLARKLRSTRGVSFDAPMSLAVHLKDAESLDLRVPLEPWPEGIDRRWRAEDVRELLKQAKDFAAQAKFKEFLAAHAEFYAETTSRAKKLVLEQGHLEWFGTFFGERPGAQFHLVPALVNGPNCYGPHCRAGTNEEFYCVLGVWETDWKGKPWFGKPVLDTVAHEFCHSYVNPHIYARSNEFRAAGEKLFAKVQDQMRRQAYGNWQTMLHESVVRAAVVRYVTATQSQAAGERQAQGEVQRGFAWTPQLAALLAEYEAKRGEFPNFGAIMPRIVEFFNQTAAAQAGAKAD
jgi:hypothetical protein